MTRYLRITYENNLYENSPTIYTLLDYTTYKHLLLMLKTFKVIYLNMTKSYDKYKMLPK
jgi:hypothetical protein